jgi:histidinol phosphatase-like enzyme
MKKIKEENTGYRVIAVDFDGTLVTDKFPEIGDPIYGTINAVKEEQSRGNKVILWTCRSGKYLEEAVAWAKTHKINFDEVNNNLKEYVDMFGNDCRKVFAHEYWDDKALTVTADSFPERCQNLQ